LNVITPDEESISISELEVLNVIDESSVSSSVADTVPIVFWFSFALKDELEVNIGASSSRFVIEIEKVSETIFVKMNGTYETMQELKYEFELFCKSIHWVK